MPIQHSVLTVKAVVAAFNQEKALVGAFSVITNLRTDLFEALVHTDTGDTGTCDRCSPSHHSLDTRYLDIQILSMTIVQISTQHEDPMQLCHVHCAAFVLSKMLTNPQLPHSAQHTATCCHVFYYLKMLTILTIQSSLNQIQTNKFMTHDPLCVAFSDQRMKAHLAL